MNFCTLHENKPYQFICKSLGCDLPLLCSDCRKNHLLSSKNDRFTHAAQIVTLRHAMEQAYSKISTNLKNLQQLRMPQKSQDEIKMKISDQIRQLNAERNRIIASINDVFQKQIEMLSRANNKSSVNNANAAIFEQIETKINNLQSAKLKIKSDLRILKQMLVYNDEKFINELRKVNAFSSMNFDNNQYYIYDNIKHDFFLSRLQLKRKPIQQKLLQKVYNQSDLYFLIDNYQQGNFLHYFTSGDNLLRMYNLDVGTWTQRKFVDPVMPNYAATLYQNISGRFYLIGGQSKGQKSRDIYWFSNQQGWRRVPSMLTGRSSAMATILYDKTNKKNHYILIAGGIGDQRKNLKTCQIFNPKNQKCYQVASMNFAVISGALLTFNDTIAIRLGGLGQFQQNIASICQAPQKYDLTNIIENISQQQPNKNQNPSQIIQEEKKSTWSYLDLQIINTEIQKKFNLFYAHQAAIQINPNQIFVFGGITHSNMGVNESYIIQIQSITNKFNRKSSRYYVRWVNEKKLISAEGFLGLRPIIYKKKVMSLQNITVKGSPNDIYEQEKRLIQFNMYEWKQIQNIVPF